jgi:hypothetical protein
VTHTTERAKSAAEKATENGNREHKTPAQIEAEIKRTRAQLAGTIDEIADRVHPRHVAKRQAGRVKGTVVDDTGRPRTKRIAISTGVSVLVFGIMMWRKRRK